MTTIEEDEDKELNSVENLNEMIFQLAKENDEHKADLELSLQVIDEKERDLREAKEDYLKLENYYGIQVNELEKKVAELNETIEKSKMNKTKKNLPNWLKSEVITNIPLEDRRKRISVFEAEGDEDFDNNDDFAEFKKILENKDKMLEEQRLKFENELKRVSEKYQQKEEHLRAEIENEKEAQLQKESIKSTLNKELKEQSKDYTKLLSEIDNNKGDIEQYKKTIAKLKAEIEDVKIEAQRESKDKFMQIVNLNKKINDMKFMNSLHEQEKTKMLADRNSLDKLYSSQKKQLDLLLIEYNNIKDELMSIKDKINQHGDEGKDWLKHVNSLHGRRVSQYPDELIKHTESEGVCHKGSNLCDLLDDDDEVKEDIKTLTNLNLVQEVKKETKEESLKKTKLNYLNKLKNKKKNAGVENVFQHLNIKELIKEENENENENNKDNENVKKNTEIINEVITTPIHDSNNIIEKNSKESKENVIEKETLNNTDNIITTDTTNNNYTNITNSLKSKPRLTVLNVDTKNKIQKKYTSTINTSNQSNETNQSNQSNQSNQINKSNQISNNLDENKNSTKLSWLRAQRNKGNMLNTFQIYQKLSEVTDKLNAETQYSSEDFQGLQDNNIKTFSNQEDIIITNEFQIILLACFNEISKEKEAINEKSKEINKNDYSKDEIIPISHDNPDILYQKYKTENEYLLNDLKEKNLKFVEEIENLTRENFSLNIKLENFLIEKDVEVNKLKMIIKKLKEKLKV